MLSSYLISLVSGLFVYLLMLIDANYIEPTDKPISPKIPLLVVLLIWLIVVFYKPSETIHPLLKQKPLVGGFYN